MKTFVGVDYHKAFSYGTILDEKGAVLKQGRFDNDLQSLQEFLEDYGGEDCSGVLEATRNWCVMHDWLEQLTSQVTLAHPKKVRAIAEARVKTDKIDSATLAHLLRCDLIPAAHVSSPQARVLKNLLRHRMVLVRLSTMTKNRVHVLIDRHPTQRQQWHATELFTAAGLAWLGSLALPEADRHILDGELALLAKLRELLKETEGYLAQVGQQDERIARLRSIPGIGRFFAMLLLCEIDDIERFATPAKLHAYAGLVPSTYSSGGKTYHGKIIKAGNKYLRWAMIEAIWPAIQKDAGIRRLYERVARKGVNKARIATARRLLTIVYRVLKENRDYREAA